MENHLKNLNLKISILSFIDDGLLLTQSKSLQVSNICIFSSYNITFNLLSKFGLLVKHLKTEIFYFSRVHGVFNPPALDLSSLGGLVLYLKNTWKYLDFIFNRKLLFCYHINFYANKALLMVKCMKILGNLTRGLILYQKCLLYRSYALPIVLYKF